MIIPSYQASLQVWLFFVQNQRLKLGKQHLKQPNFSETLVLLISFWFCFGNLLNFYQFVQLRVDIRPFVQWRVEFRMFFRAIHFETPGSLAIFDCINFTCSMPPFFLRISQDTVLPINSTVSQTISIAWMKFAGREGI